MYVVTHIRTLRVESKVGIIDILLCQGIYKVGVRMEVKGSILIFVIVGGRNQYYK